MTSTEPPPRPLSSPRTIGGLLVALLAFLYCASWYNRYLGVTTDGWFFHFATRLLGGEVPYRDFHLFAPPLHVFEHAALIQLFGERLYFAHLVGLLQRVVLALILYRWLERLYGAPLAVIASLTTVVVFSADVADTVFFYHHDSVFWSVLAIDAALRFDEAASGSRRWWLSGLFCGGLAALAFSCKQTTGLGISVALPVILVALAARSAGWRAALLRLAPYTVAWAAVVTPLWAWLASEGALRPFLDQVFLRASSKGPLLEVLTRSVLDAFRVEHLGLAAGVALAGLLLARFGPRVTARLRSAGAPVGLLAAGTALGLAIETDWFWLGSYPRLAAAYATLFGTAALSLWFAWRWLGREELAPRDRQRWLIAAGAFALAYMFSLSWPAWELMVLPGFGLLLGEAAFGSPERPRGALAQGVVAGLCVVVVLVASWDKRQSPFEWSEWREPPLSASVRSSDLPALAGFELSESTAGFLEAATDAIVGHSRPDDAVFVFPHVPILYVLSERRPSTFCAVHWFDVVPDELAERDAAELLRDPPQVIVSFPISAREWRANEVQYRAGRAAGQRRIVEAIRALVEGGGYEPVAALPGPTNGEPVRIWARRGPGRP